ncbi:TetR/AcrR family transcriptional regulator [Collimonas sp.]|jgi:AcrR family transcriptional regulator|uniref:TetR/AcrR family transcriptional regulator n=1 Tax=Collimonas sp. TaxID=1963772 RepID=UPI002BAE59BF|nr:TetR/AcrR family transcriptional regulator [Collimonas sp.]HWX03264.1 TetR/AcrR family transcriptional regulator [Collimonas sp.]
MEQKENKRVRGRPRAYDPEQALDEARDVFWQQGYGGSSLDDLSSATGMNRPSLYAAFGDKHALYLQTLERYVERSRQAMIGVMGSELPLAQALLRVYQLALGMYLPPGGAARGCLLIGTAATQAVTDGEVRQRLGDGLRCFDQVLEVRFQRAVEQGELVAALEPAMLAKMASAILHTLALRSRAGDSRASLEATAAAGVQLICGQAAAGR